MPTNASWMLKKIVGLRGRIESWQEDWSSANIDDDPSSKEEDPSSTSIL